LSVIVITGEVCSDPSITQPPLSLALLKVNAPAPLTVIDTLDGPQASPPPVTETFMIVALVALLAVVFQGRPAGVISAHTGLLPVKAADTMEALPFDAVLPPSFALQLTVSPSAVSISAPDATNFVLVGVNE
jgi:hypothetical protein